VPRAVRDRVAGVDGCPAGWVVALVPVTDADENPSEVHVVSSFSEVLALRPAAIAIDMPIGLAAAGQRACDVEVRRRLGPRRASVFPTPIRAVLAASTYVEALAIGRAVDGRGMSKQSFHLLPKVRELDALITPPRQRTIVECHPELCFATMTGAPCAHPKRTAAGRAERLGALRTAFPDVDLHLAAPHRGAKSDDVLDAFATAWTARRVVAGTAEHIRGERDERGLRMEIVI
jgi:predicted RNase H-like nuclease